jgi:elongation factor Ts
MEINALLVKELREKTGCAVMDCKKALLESKGDFEKAVTYLKQKNLMTAAKKSSRATTEGGIVSYIHPGSKVGVLLELNCETDFVARNLEFKELAKNLTMHIAALNPLYIKKEDVPLKVIEQERAIYLTHAQSSGKPEKVWQKIVEGKLEKFYTEVCLMEQTYIRDDQLTVKDVITNTIAKLGENISIRRFIRYQLGEELN